MWIGWCYRLILLGLIAMALSELFRENLKMKMVAALVLVPLILRFLMVA